MNKLTDKIFDKFDTLDDLLKDEILNKIFNIIKIDINKKLEILKYNIRLKFIENHANLIANIRNDNMLLEHKNIIIPSYCLYIEDDIINEFKVKKNYTYTDIKLLKLYGVYNIPYIK